MYYFGYNLETKNENISFSYTISHWYCENSIWIEKLKLYKLNFKWNCEFQIEIEKYPNLNWENSKLYFQFVFKILQISLSYSQFKLKNSKFKVKIRNFIWNFLNVMYNVLNFNLKWCSWSFDKLLINVC